MGATKETFFISHGSPTLSIDDSLPARHFLKSFTEKIYSEKPKWILIISAHWETDHPTVNSVAAVGHPFDTIYDFYNFPKHLYTNCEVLGVENTADLQNKFIRLAPGSPELATRVKEVLTASGFDQVSIDKKRGLDHGAWVPLMLMYPEADIPVCQLSIQTNKDATYHYNLGKALAPLKEQGVLIIGSGSATHNLRNLRQTKEVASWALEFDNWVKDALLAGRFKDVNDYEEKAPYAKMAHPWPDHFYPLHVAMGAADENAKGQLIHSSWDLNTLSYSSYKFT